jgi:hypothetical protein
MASFVYSDIGMQVEVDFDKADDLILNLSSL